MRMISPLIGCLMLGACGGNSTDFIGGMAKEVCRGQSNCALREDTRPSGTPDGWYEDSYGRDERDVRRR